jgi:hypothetical protein
MDAGSGDEIQRGNEFRVGPDRLDATTLELAEELCRRFRLEKGMTALELRFHNGHVELAWLHERAKLKRIAEAYEPGGAPA